MSDLKAHLSALSAEMRSQADIWRGNARDTAVARCAEDLFRFSNLLAALLVGAEPQSAKRDEWRLDDEGCLDDVVVEDVATFRMERISDDHIWGAIYRRDGSRTSFNIHGDRVSLMHEDDMGPASPTADLVAVGEEPAADHPQEQEDEVTRVDTPGSPVDIHTAASFGVHLIAAERERQQAVEGWTPKHDEQHSRDELIQAARCYLWATNELSIQLASDRLPLDLPLQSRNEWNGHVAERGSFDWPVSAWPWEPAWWKPGNDPIRCLEKAGALIAAEIDRRFRSRPSAPPGAASPPQQENKDDVSRVAPSATIPPTGSTAHIANGSSEALDETCLCAAIQMPDGYIVRGHRHDDCLITAGCMPGYTKEDLHRAVQGFLTTRARFVDRTEGANVQQVAGIVSANNGRFTDYLFSEDLYLRPRVEEAHDEARASDAVDPSVGTQERRPRATETLPAASPRVHHGDKDDKDSLTRGDGS